MTRPYSEAQTRQQVIDRRLALAGWNVDDPSQVTEELDIDLTGKRKPAVSDTQVEYKGHQFADYALLLKGKPAAVVEAKKTSVDAQLGQEQALTYANNLVKLNGEPLPLISYTNGHDIYFWESEFYPPAKVHGFPTRDDLDWLCERREQRRPLSVEMIDTSIVERDYQIAAIRTILEQLEAKRHKFLLVMATGTGKTRTAIALVELLMRARWAKRVLFLVDRIALKTQALDAFKEHMPSEPRWPEPGEFAFARNRRVYVTTYPSMLNLIHAGTTPETWISPYFFDVVSADESHRSIYNIYKQVVDYFHGIKLGLTATPRDHVDHDTFATFECAVRDPTFAYSFEEALEHDPPYLSGYEVLKVRSKFQLEGIKGGTLPPDEQLQLIEQGRDPEDIDFEGTDLEHKVTNAPTNAIVVREFMEESIKDPSGTLPGKSIIFAVSVKHARRLQDLFDQMYPEHRGRLARVIVSDDRFVYGVGGLLHQFKHEDMPRVAISVDMLDTGIDIHEIVNLVFAKPVYSYVKFWQMIGRGTRVLNDDPAKRKPWCTKKDKFLIIDCWGNFDYFDMHPAGREPGQLVPLPVRLFQARLDKLEAAIAASATEVAETVKQDLRADIAALPANNVVVAEAEKDLAVVRDDAFWDRLSAKDIGFLRTTITPVMRVRTDVDFKSMRFEKDLVELSTALLAKNDETTLALKGIVLAQVEELPISVNVVARERDLIESVKRDHWWTDVSDEKLRDLASRLGRLMKYRRRLAEPMMKLNLADLVAIKETIEFGPQHERMSTSAYRERVEAFVRELVAENTVLQKIQAGREVDAAELEELAELLGSQNPHVTEELLQKIYDNRKASFLQFMRHILGLEQLEAWSTEVSREFDRFIAEHTTLTAIQIRFLQTLRTFILQMRTLEKRHLIESPFTQIHPKGIRGVFKEAEIEEILALSRELVA